MMRSMFSGVSGLRVHQTKMDVIANNIANVNTNGYKSSRVTFSEIFSQTLQGATGANAAAEKGGRNALQIGLGSNIASIDMLMTSGAAQRTDNPYDLMIQGDGFFIVGDSGGTYFSRAGAFRLDNLGNLATPDGLVLNGWKAVESSTNPGEYEILKTKTTGINISGTDEYLQPQPTKNIKFSGNLNAASDPAKPSTVAFYDSIGNRYVMDVTYEFYPAGSAGNAVAAEDEWRVTFGTQLTLNGDKSNPVYVDVAADGTVTFAATPPGSSATISTPVKFNLDGTFKSPATPLELKLPADASGSLIPGSSFENIKVDFSGLTQMAGKVDAASETLDGYAPGKLTRISIGADGVITGQYSNGLTKPLWQIAIAKFKNPAGLERVGNNYYAVSANSGEFDGIGTEAADGTSLLAGVLEMANVDLAQEFTEMITTQRGFQANSRVITTSDDMLQELVNLKR